MSPQKNAMSTDQSHQQNGVHGCILGLETSCDETGVAIFDPQSGIIAEALRSQIDVHQGYGGVVPELASRDHIQSLLPLARQVLKQARKVPGDLHAVAYTAGPGLAGALLVGTAIGRSLAFALDIPALAVHHMEAHLLAPMLEEDPPQYPFLALLVSGGHTLLVEVRAFRDYVLLGESLDDAVGEVLDKTAKLLGLPYPGGAALSSLAEQGNPGRFRFPRPMTNRPGLDFSFSGLKTHAVTVFRAHEDGPALRADIARAFMDAVVDTLLIKCQRALVQTGLHRCVVAGGVSANRQLRAALQGWGDGYGVRFFFPRSEWCVDNGAMIAYAGYLQWQAGLSAPMSFPVYPRWPITRLGMKETGSSG